MDTLPYKCISVLCEVHAIKQSTSNIKVSFGIIVGAVIMITFNNDTKYALLLCCVPFSEL